MKAVQRKETGMYDDELRWRMSDEHIRRAVETKNMVRRAMRNCERKERETARGIRKVAFVLAVCVAVGGAQVAKAVRTAKAEEARLRASGAIVDRILVYDMDGNLILD